MATGLLQQRLHGVEAVGAERIGVADQHREIAQDGSHEWTLNLRGGQTYRIVGDPTEGALVVAAAKAGLMKEELEALFPRLAEIPFSSESKRMTSLHRTADGLVVYSKGAPEIMLSACSRRLTSRGEMPLDDAARSAISDQAVSCVVYQCPLSRWRTRR